MKSSREKSNSAESGIISSVSFRLHGTGVGHWSDWMMANMGIATVSIESTGMYNSDELFLQAVQILRKKCVDFEEKLLES